MTPTQQSPPVIQPGRLLFSMTPTQQSPPVDPTLVA
jgi:hypothetical protein